MRIAIYGAGSLGTIYQQGYIPKHARSESKYASGT